jgi:signal transduction histidine kinase
MAWFNQSLERQTTIQSGVTLLLLWLLAGSISWLWPLWWVWLTALACSWFGSRLVLQNRRQLLSAFRRASVQLDALQLQDYSLQAKPAYQRGVVAEFQQQLQQLANQLQQRKSFFDEQQFLLYRLIDQLNTPILVLNHKLQLSYANDQFHQLFGQPWQSLKHSSAASLGLEVVPHWQFIEPERRQQWQIRHSRFVDQGERYQLLVFIDIELALRENQLQAWQQLIRVLSHEIRNSLTPVQSLAEYLLQKATPGREQDALSLIYERSQHLQDFVSRYAQLSKPLSVNLQPVQADTLGQSLQLLFPQAGLTYTTTPLCFCSDLTLLQQLLINLVKNAIEAGSPAGTLYLSIEQQQQHICIQLFDQGHGLLNAADLFVPFYTTKPQGQGIGLSLCRQIARTLGGELTLTNRVDGIRGACARLLLPLQPPGAETAAAHPV